MLKNWVYYMQQGLQSMWSKNQRQTKNMQLI